MQFGYEEDLIKPPVYLKSKLDGKEHLFDDIIHRDIEELALARLQELTKGGGGGSGDAGKKMN